MSQSAGSSKVYVIVDREFGKKIAELPVKAPVWIVDSPINREIVHQLWNRLDGDSQLRRITLFHSADSSSPEESLLSGLDLIDLRRGYDPTMHPYTELEAIGIELTERSKAELTGFGFDEFERRESGFRSTRPVPGLSRR